MQLLLGLPARVVVYGPPRKETGVLADRPVGPSGAIGTRPSFKCLLTELT